MTTLPVRRSPSSRTLLRPGACCLARDKIGWVAAMSSLIWSGWTRVVFTRACMCGSSLDGHTRALFDRGQTERQPGSFRERPPTTPLLVRASDQLEQVGERLSQV